MADPTSLQIIVCNAVHRPIPGAIVKLVARRGIEWREDKGEATAPVTHALRAGFIQLEVDAVAPDYIPERGILDFVGSGLRWECTNPAWSLREEQGTAILEVTLGRIWFAPIVALPDDHRVQVPFNPGGVLVNSNGYRTVGLNSENFRTLRQPATGNPDEPGWDRFRWEDSKRPLNLAERGNWLILEYGDPSGRPDSLRHLIGVWAPHTFSGERPPVLVQITPNTRPPYYPADGLPFSGLYPYGCVADQTKAPNAKALNFALRDCRQAYVELPSNRCLGQFKILYQLYAARPDIFDGPHGPIVITPSPAFLSKGGILREPFNHREGMGRLIAEVLRFLWSRKLTLGMTLDSLHLRFQPPKVSLGGFRPVVTATGFPTSSITTVVCHSAGVGPALELAGHARGAEFSKQFPVTLFGGPNDYCEGNWQNLWVIDGVGTPGGIGVPSPGSSAVRTWLAWLKGNGRRMVLVYTPSGLGGAVAPELIRLTEPRRSGKSGWIEEGFNGKVSWLQVSYSYLQAQDPSKPDGVLPKFAPAKSDGDPTHNKVYEFGVGYAARVAGR